MYDFYYALRRVDEGLRELPAVVNENKLAQKNRPHVESGAKGGPNLKECTSEPTIQELRHQARLFCRNPACTFLTLMCVKGCAHPKNHVISGFVRTRHAFKLHIAKRAESPERGNTAYLEFARVVAHQELTVCRIHDNCCNQGLS
jgi:hypothetical protein